MRIQRCITKWIFKGAAVAAEDNYDQERLSLPEYRIGKLLIYGNSAFAADVAEALSKLQSAYPYGYSLVQRYIRAIVQSCKPPTMGIANAVVYQKSTPDGKLGFAANRFGAFLVRRAVAARKEVVFRLHKSLRSEVKSLNRELRAMKLLDCDSKYFHPVVNQILKKERRLREAAEGK